MPIDSKEVLDSNKESLEEILGCIKFYLGAYRKTGKRVEMMRCRYRIMQYRETQCSEDPKNLSYKQRLKLAKKRYNSLFPNGETFSPNRKF